MPRIRRAVGALDWVMLALAVVSVGLLVYEAMVPLSPAQARLVVLADYALIGIFALEFLYRWTRDPRPRTFPLRNWYDVLGMIPVSHPLVRGFRLFRIVRIVVILSRFGRAADRAFGQEFPYRLLQRFKEAIVDTVSGAVTVRVLEETAEVLEKGAYARNLAAHLEAHGEEILAIAVEKVKADPEVGAVRHMPFFDQVVATSGRVSQRIAIDLLRDPRIEAMVRTVIRDNVEQIKAAVRAHDAEKALGTGAQGT